MLNLEIKGIAKGTCCWCGRAKDEILTACFTDKSFSGAMCWNDFRRALRMKLGSGTTKLPPHPSNSVEPK